MLKGLLSHNTAVKTISPFIYGGGLLLLYYIPMFFPVLAILETFLIFYLLNKLLAWFEKNAKPSGFDHIRQSLIYYVIVITLVVRAILNSENVTFSAIGIGLTAIIAIVMNGVFLYRKRFSVIAKGTRDTQDTTKSGYLENKRIILLIVAVLVLWHGIVHRDYLKYLAWHVDLTARNIETQGESIRSVRYYVYGAGYSFTGDSVADEKKFNDNWKKETIEDKFDYQDVRYFMKKWCPIKSDAEIEAEYNAFAKSIGTNPTDKINFINDENRERDYQIRFLNRDFSVLKDGLQNGK
jgi:hypothetical protein